MKYKKAATGIMSVALAASMIVPAGAAQDQGIVKTETVYVKADKTGSVKETIVSDWLQNASESPTIKDRSTLNQIKNVKGDEIFQRGKKNAITWQANGKDIYYQGTTDEETPVQLKASYYLDGKKIDPEKLDGKSGELKIKITAENSTDTPFTVMSMLTMPADQCSNVTVTNGRVISDGKNEIAVGITMPGLMDQLDLDDYNGETYESVTVKCQIEDFEPVSIYNIAMNGLLNDINLDDADEITNLLDELKDSSKQLADGSKELSDSIGTLSDKAKEYTDGIAKYIAGVEKYSAGVTQVSSGLSQLANGSGKLVSGSDSVAEGAEKINQSVTTLASSMKQLQTGAASVSDGIATLDSSLAQIEAAVAAAAPSEEEKAQLQAVDSQIAQQEAVLSSIEDQSSNEYAALAGAIQIEKNLKSKLESSMSSSAQLSNAISQIRSYTKSGGTLSAGAKAVADGLGTAAAGADKIEAGTKTLSEGAKTVASGTGSLNSGIQAAKQGTDQLTANNATLSKSGKTINSASAAVNEGISKLEKGAKTLTDGMFKFDRDGIQKGTESVDKVFDKMDELIDKDADYQNFSGISKDMEGEVKFIIEME